MIFPLTLLELIVSLDISGFLEKKNWFFPWHFWKWFFPLTFFYFQKKKLIFPWNWFFPKISGFLFADISGFFYCSRNVKGKIVSSKKMLAKRVCTHIVGEEIVFTTSIGHLARARALFLSLSLSLSNVRTS